MSSNTGHTGRVNEITAWLWLAKQGYEVFDNIGPNGPVDCIALHRETGEVIKVQVKGGVINQNTGAKYCQRLTEEQARLGCRLLMVTKAGECEWVDPVDAAPLPKRGQPRGALHGTRRGMH